MNKRKKEVIEQTKIGSKKKKTKEKKHLKKIFFDLYLVQKEKKQTNK